MLVCFIFFRVLKKESKSRYELSTKGTGWWFVNKFVYLDHSKKRNTVHEE